MPTEMPSCAFSLQRYTLKLQPRTTEGLTNSSCLKRFTCPLPHPFHKDLLSLYCQAETVWGLRWCNFFTIQGAHTSQDTTLAREGLEASPPHGVPRESAPCSCSKCDWGLRATVCERIAVLQGLCPPACQQVFWHACTEQILLPAISLGNFKSF